MMINLHKICISCSWRNTNSKYCNNFSIVHFELHAAVHHW